MAHRATRHLILLCQLKCLTALKPNQQQFSELYLYDALNLLSCMTLDAKSIPFIFLHHKDKLFTLLITQETLSIIQPLPSVLMAVTFHLWNERLIFTSEEVPAS